MLTVQDIARRKKVETSQLKPEAMGPYDHQAQRRWIGCFAYPVEYEEQH